jgi:hypothetical protein
MQSQNRLEEREWNMGLRGEEECLGGSYGKKAHGLILGPGQEKET